MRRICRCLLLSLCPSLSFIALNLPGKATFSPWALGFGKTQVQREVSPACPRLHKCSSPIFVVVSLNEFFRLMLRWFGCGRCGGLCLQGGLVSFLGGSCFFISPNLLHVPALLVATASVGILQGVLPFPRVLLFHKISGVEGISERSSKASLCPRAGSITLCHW